MRRVRANRVLIICLICWSFCLVWIHKNMNQNVQNDEIVTFCKQLMKDNGVQPGKSWGRLKNNIPLRSRWDEFDCTSVIRNGKMMTITRANQKKNQRDIIMHESNSSFHIMEYQFAHEESIETLNYSTVGYRQFHNNFVNFQCHKRSPKFPQDKLELFNQFLPSLKLPARPVVKKDHRHHHDHHSRHPPRKSHVNGVTNRRHNISIHHNHNRSISHIKHGHNNHTLPSRVYVHASSPDLPTAALHSQSHSHNSHRHRQLRSSTSHAQSQQHAPLRINAHSALSDTSAAGDRIMEYLRTIFASARTASSNRINTLPCDVRVHEPAVIVSHDSVTNLGHMFQDVMNWWLVAVLNEVDMKQAVLVNIDGLRPGSILLGQGRHVPNLADIDGVGPFAVMYEVMFKRVIRAQQVWGSGSGTGNLSARSQRRIADLNPLIVESNKSNIVCFDKALLYPMPLKGFLWEKFETVDHCSEELQQSGGSFVYRSFVFDYMRGWYEHGQLSKHVSEAEIVLTSLHTPENYTLVSANVRVLLIDRRAAEGQVAAEMSSLDRARVIANHQEVVHALFSWARTINQLNPACPYHLDMHSGKPVHSSGRESSRSLSCVQVIVQALQDLPFHRQVALVQSVDVLVGFHGAGINHLFHLKSARPKCCGVVEIFPQAHGCQAPVKDHGHGPSHRRAGSARDRHRHVSSKDKSISNHTGYDSDNDSDSDSDVHVCKFHLRKGHGNHARFLGYRYEHITAANNSFGPLGTTLDTNHLLRAITATLPTS